MRPHALHPGAIQGKEGIKFCHLATLMQVRGGEEGHQLQQQELVEEDRQQQEELPQPLLVLQGPWGFGIQGLQGLIPKEKGGTNYCCLMALAIVSTFL